jgi:hypothetical protein
MSCQVYIVNQSGVKVFNSIVLFYAKWIYKTCLTICPLFGVHSSQKVYTMDPNKTFILRISPPEARVVECLSGVRRKSHAPFLEGGAEVILCSYSTDYQMNESVRFFSEVLKLHHGNA